VKGLRAPASLDLDAGEVDREAVVLAPRRWLLTLLLMLRLLMMLLLLKSGAEGSSEAEASSSMASSIGVRGGGGVIGGCSDRIDVRRGEDMPTEDCLGRRER